MSGDEKATNRGEFGATLHEQRGRLHAIARRAGSKEPEDVVQDAFLKVVETSQRQEILKVDNFLSRVVRYLAIGRYRRRKFRGGAVGLELREDYVDPAADPETALIGAQRLERVMAALNGMPPRRREVFLLHRVEELSYSDIARRLGISLKMVEKHLHLAMRELSDTDD